MPNGERLNILRAGKTPRVFLSDPEGERFSVQYLDRGSLRWCMNPKPEP